MPARVRLPRWMLNDGRLIWPLGSAEWCAELSCTTWGSTPEHCGGGLLCGNHRAERFSSWPALHPDYYATPWWQATRATAGSP